MPDQPTPKTGLELLTDSVTKMGVIIGAVFTLNTSINSCTEADSQRAARFNAAVASEEAYWKGLYDAYGNAMKSDVAADERIARVLAIYALAGHPTPDFRNYRLGLVRDQPAVKTAAAEHLVSLRRTLRTAIQNNDSLNGAIGMAVRDADFAAEETTKLRPREGRRVLATTTLETKAALQETAAAPASESGTINYAAQVIGAGVPTGWDIDVYWCAGANAGINYGVARAAAEVLARQADAKPPLPLAPGAPLGRIRLRSLPESRQGPSSDYPIDGYSVVYDGGAGEKDVAGLVRSKLSTATNYRVDLVRSRSASKWYLSIFVCKLHPNAATAPPATAS